MIYTIEPGCLPTYDNDIAG